MALLQGAQMTDPEQNDIGWQPIPCPISISVNKAPDAGHFCRQWTVFFIERISGAGLNFAFSPGTTWLSGGSQGRGAISADK